MALRNSQYDALMRYYQKLQLRNKHDQDERIREAYEKIPRLAQIDREIASASLQKARVLLGEPEGPDFNLNQRIRQLSQERTRLLISHGYPADYLRMQYACPICQATGYVDNKICISYSKIYTENINVVIAQAADELLTVKNIEASFILGEKDGTIFISARSLGKINVHVLMEKLGGGGHIDIAGAQLQGVSIDEAYNKVKQIIEQYLREED